MIKAIIFDFDGLLVNTEELRELSIRNFLMAKGKRFKVRDYIALMKTTSDETAMFLKKKFELNESIAEITSQRRNFFEELFESRLVLMEGVGVFLRKLRSFNLKKGIASGRNKKDVFDGLTRLGIIDSFEVIITAEDVNKLKPDPEGYLLAAKKLRVSPGECIAFEDTPHGIEAAKMAGMTCVYIPSARYFDSHHPKADLIVESFAKISNSIFRKLVNGK